MCTPGVHVPGSVRYSQITISTPSRETLGISLDIVRGSEGKTAMKSYLSAIALAAAIGMASPALAQSPPPVTPDAGAQLLVTVTNPAKIKLTVTTQGWKDGEDIPFKYTQYQGNEFPGLEWSKGPASTK